MRTEPLLTVTDVTKHFPAGGGFLARPRAPVMAVNGVSFTLRRGQTLGLVGESGCGKSTLARVVVRLLTPSGGHVCFDGREIGGLGRRELRPFRRRMQFIFQDPYASLDPRMSVADSITEPLRGRRGLSRSDRREQAARLLTMVGLSASDRDRHPHEFSGGQHQRIGIARALCVRPELVVADEPVSALDVSIQAQILNLMKDLQHRLDLAYLFISHDISVVQHFCDRIAVMYAGRLVEIAAAPEFHIACRHPYTRALMDAVPRPDPRVGRSVPAAEGEPPDPAALPSGCPYHPRCRYAFARCPTERPPLAVTDRGHKVACWLNGGRGVNSRL